MAGELRAEFLSDGFDPLFQGVALIGEGKRRARIGAGFGDAIGKRTIVCDPEKMSPRLPRMRPVVRPIPCPRLLGYAPVTGPSFPMTWGRVRLQAVRHSRVVTIIIIPPRRGEGIQKPFSCLRRLQFRIRPFGERDIDCDEQIARRTAFLRGLALRRKVRPPEVFGEISRSTAPESVGTLTEPPRMASAAGPKSPRAGSRPRLQVRIDGYMDGDDGVAG